MRRTLGQGPARWVGLCFLGFLGLALGVCLGASASALPDGVAPEQQQRVAQLFARAARLIQKKDFQGAAQVYEQALKIEPDSFEVLNNLGVIYARLGEYPQAANAYERALRLKPGSFPLLVNLGLAYFKGREFGKAIKPLAQAVALEPDNFQAEALLGMSYYWARDFTAASAELEKLIAAKPGNQALQYLLCESYLETGQDQKVLDFFRSIPQGSFQPVTAHLLMGEADDGLNLTRQAIEEFKAAAALAPNQSGVHFGLGFLHWKNHDNQNAAAEFWREMQAGGLVAQSEAYLGDIAIKEGANKQARALIEQALRLTPKTALADYDLGILDAQAKNYGAAAIALKDAIRLDPGQRAAHDELARVYRAQGEMGLAAAELKSAASISAQNQPKLFQMVSAAPPSAN
ncbi:MAG: tetratricopeptide repeat protein [Terriglobia bacterium]